MGIVGAPICSSKERALSVALGLVKLLGLQLLLSPRLRCSRPLDVSLSYLLLASFIEESTRDFTIEHQPPPGLAPSLHPRPWLL